MALPQFHCFSDFKICDVDFTLLQKQIPKGLMAAVCEQDTVTMQLYLEHSQGSQLPQCWD